VRVRQLPDHRRTVAELLHADGFEVQEILPDGGQLPLF
jgi:hypothetical protein